MLDALEPLLQYNVPAASVDKVDVPLQLFTTVTIGVAGVAFGFANTVIVVTFLL